MAILAGEVVTAARLNRMQPVTYTAAASSDLVGPQTSGAITGASITLTTLTNNAKVKVEGFFDFDHSASTSTVATGELFLDGSKQTRECVYQQGTASANDRMTPGQQWLLTIGTAGSHTFDLRGTLPTGITIHQTNTTITATVYEVV